jgi:SPW repeat-containing protein
MKTMTTPRVLNVIIGIWLVISAFLWSHGHFQTNNTWICGVLCAVFAVAAGSRGWSRYLNTLLAIWLFISTWVVSDISPRSTLNNLAVSIAIFVLSIFPSTSEPPLSPHAP